MKNLHHFFPGENLLFKVLKSTLNKYLNLRPVLTLGTLILLSSAVRAQSYVVNYSADLNPRGMAYYPAKKRLLISSMKDGQIGYIDGNSHYTLLLRDTILLSATALKIKDNFLYALTGDSGISSNTSARTRSKIAKLIKIDLLTNRVVSVFDLNKLYNGPHLVNDLAIDTNGTVYIIDALSPVIYQVEPAGKMSVLLAGSALTRDDRQLRAIAYHQNGYLLVALNQGPILKVDLNNHNAVSEVSIEEGNIRDINSLHFSPNHLLVVSEGGNSNQVHILNSSNSWVSARLLRTDKWDYTNPVNTEYVNNQIFVLDNKSTPRATTDSVYNAFSVRVIDLQLRPLSKKRMRVKIVPGEMTRNKTF